MCSTVGYYAPGLLETMISTRGIGAGQSCVHNHSLPQTFVCTRRASANTHIYPPLLQAVSGRGYAGRLEWVISGGWGGDMQDLGYELPRIPIPRTSVNKRMRPRFRRGQAGQWPSSTVPAPPSTVTACPSRSLSVASPAPTTAGMPY